MIFASPTVVWIEKTVLCNLRVDCGRFVLSDVLCILLAGQQLIAEFVPQMSGFDPRALNMGLMTLGQDFITPVKCRCITAPCL